MNIQDVIAFQSRTLAQSHVQKHNFYLASYRLHMKKNKTKTNQSKRMTSLCGAHDMTVLNHLQVAT